MSVIHKNKSHEIRWPKVILFGDSLTQQGYGEGGHWVSHIADNLQGRCDVVCRGFSGYNSRWCKIILPSIITREMVKDIVCVVIFLGANDSCKEALKPEQHVPVKEYKENLTNMVEYLQSIGVNNKQIILVSLPAFVEEKYQQVCLESNKVFGKSNADGAMYYEACKTASQELGTEFVDLYKTMMSEEKWQKYMSDGLHFSVSGGQFVADKIWPLIEKTTKSLGPVLPQWDTVDNGNPGTTFDSIIKNTHIH